MLGDQIYAGITVCCLWFFGSQKIIFIHYYLIDTLLYYIITLSLFIIII